MENKKQYLEIYPFRVIEELRKGENVFVLDRKKKSVVSCEDLRVFAILEILADAEADANGRFLFWKEVKK